MGCGTINAGIAYEPQRSKPWRSHQQFLSYYIIESETAGQPPTCLVYQSQQLSVRQQLLHALSSKLKAVGQPATCLPTIKCMSTTPVLSLNGKLPANQQLTWLINRVRVISDTLGTQDFVKRIGLKKAGQSH